MVKSAKEGLIYCAVGDKYLKNAEISYRSALNINNKLHAAVYSNIPADRKLWDMVIEAKTNFHTDANNVMQYKLDAIISTPYEKTIYLDSDTVVLFDINQLFKLLDKFDIVLCHGHARNERYNMILQARSVNNDPLFSDKIPNCFAPVQGGLIVYNKKTTLDFFQHVHSAFLSKGYFDDQAIIRELLWESNLRLYILPPEFNFNSFKYFKELKKSGYKIATPKIFHYTLFKGDNIEKYIRRFYNPIKPIRIKNKIFRYKSIVNKLMNIIKDLFL